MAIKVASTTVLDNSFALDNITGASGVYGGWHADTAQGGFGSTANLNMATRSQIYGQMSQNCLFSISGMLAGRSFTLLLDTNTSGHTPSFTSTATIKYPGGSQPTWSDSRNWIINFICLSSSVIYMTATSYDATTAPAGYPTGTFTVRQRTASDVGYSAKVEDSDYQNITSPAIASSTLIIRVERTSSGAQIEMLKNIAGDGQGTYYNLFGAPVSFGSSVVAWQDTSSTATVTHARIDKNGFAGTWTSLPSPGSAVTDQISAYAEAQQQQFVTDDATALYEIYLRSNEFPDALVASFRNYVYAQAQNDTCFLGNCLVTMWNPDTESFYTMQIEDLYNAFHDENNDQTYIVYGNDSGKNQVVNAWKHTVNKTLFGFNGGAPFVTGGHPFLTPQGWKCIDPEAGSAKYPELNLTKLKVGDEINTFDYNTHSYSGIEITSFTSQTVYDTNVYSLDVSGQNTPLIDGNDTYIVDNYVVHNK